MKGRRNPLNNLPLAGKVYGGFGLSMLFLAGLAGLSVWGLTRAVDSLKIYEELATQKTLLIKEIGDDVRDMRLAVMKFRVKQDPAAIAGVEEAVAKALGKRDAAEAAITDPSQVEILQGLIAGIQQYGERFTAAVALQDQRNEVVLGTLDRIGPAVRKDITEIMETAYQDGDATAAYYAGVVQKHLMLGRLYASKFLITNEPSDGDRAKTELADAIGGIDALLVELQNPRRRELAEGARVQITDYTAAFERTQAIILDRNAILIGELDAIGPRLLGQVTGLIDFALQVQTETSAAVSGDIAELQRNTVIAAVIALVVGILCAFLIARAIVVPIRAVTGYMGRLADGDTDFQNRQDDRDDEIGKMMIALKSLKETVRKAFTQAQMIEEMPAGVMVADASASSTVTYLNKEARQVLKRVATALPVGPDDVVGSSVTRLHETLSENREVFQNPGQLPWNATISIGSEKLAIQASAVLDNKGEFVGPMFAITVVTERERMANDFEENVKGTVDNLTTAFSEMSAKMRSMVDGARHTVDQSISVASSAEQSSQSVQTVAAASEELASSIDEVGSQVSTAAGMARQALESGTDASAKVESLAEIAQQIDQVVNLISEIAAQTNLLALNATIEAARAGEAGKGFAVVAEEVKSLAGQTASATQSIAEQIQAMQAATNSTVSAFGNVSRVVEEMNEVFAAVAAAVEEQTAATSEISNSAQQASSGTAEVSQSIVGVKDASTRNGDDAEELLRETERLGEAAETLGGAADRFLATVRAA